MQYDAHNHVTYITLGLTIMFLVRYDHMNDVTEG
jgi:hypothetical protein